LFSNSVELGNRSSKRFEVEEDDDEIGKSTCLAHVSQQPNWKQKWRLKKSEPTRQYRVERTPVLSVKVVSTKRDFTILGLLDVVVVRELIERRL